MYNERIFPFLSLDLFDTSILSIFSSDFCQNCIIFFNHRNTTTFLVENEELCVKALLSKIY